jgi:hypothetical protein
LIGIADKRRYRPNVLELLYRVRSFLRILQWLLSHS